MGLFIIIVIVGVFAVLIMTNQSPKTNNKQTLDELPKIKITPETMVTEIANPITETGKGKISKGIIKTNKGGIELDFYINDAPNTISNFVKKQKQDFIKILHSTASKIGLLKVETLRKWYRWRQYVSRV